MEDDRLIDCGGMVVGGGGGGGGGNICDIQSKEALHFYWNNNCIILPKSVDLPQVSASYYYWRLTDNLHHSPLIWTVHVACQKTLVAVIAGEAVQWPTPCIDI